MRRQADFSSDNDETGDEKEATSRYDSIAIVSPEDDTAIRENSGQVSVSVSVQPALSEAHQIVLYMDGTEAARSRSPIFQFSNVDRGTHTLAAAIVGSDGNEIIRSDSISFTLHRHSVQNPNNPNAPDSSGSSPTNPPSGGVNAPSPSGPTPTNPPRPAPQYTLDHSPVGIMPGRSGYMRRGISPLIGLHLAAYLCTAVQLLSVQIQLTDCNG
ncbi:MAG: hypothetical protein U5P41_11375 [Gammaproteobacteria bacterium]|nr:hypothetical protein [Gammaproteobacteria bacterium]